MSVESVNNSNNNAGLYALGAAVAGAGAGAGTAYLTKPFLKDGAPTDSFIKNIEENIIETFDEDSKKAYEEGKKLLTDFDAIQDKEALKTYLKDNHVNLGISEDMLEAGLKEIDDVEQEFSAIKAEIRKGISVGLEYKDGLLKSAFENSWDANKGKFVHDADKISLKGFNAVKKAARSIQGKYALIYGSIAAAVLGIGTYLATMGNKAEAPAPEQKVDTQA